MGKPKLHRPKNLAGQAIFILIIFLLLHFLFSAGLNIFRPSSPDSPSCSPECVEYLDDGKICIRECDYLKGEILVVFEHGTSFKKAIGVIKDSSLDAHEEVCQADVCYPAETFFETNAALTVKVPEGAEKSWANRLSQSKFKTQGIVEAKRISELTLARFYNPSPEGGQWLEELVE